MYKLLLPLIRFNFSRCDQYWHHLPKYIELVPIIQTFSKIKPNGQCVVCTVLFSPEPTSWGLSSKFLSVTSFDKYLSLLVQLLFEGHPDSSLEYSEEDKEKMSFDKFLIQMFEGKICDAYV